MFVSATPGAYELRHSTRVAEQLVRPTGIVDPEVELRDEEPDRRPARRGPPARGGRRARAGDDADEEDGRGPDRLPARVGRSGALPALEVDTLERIQIIRELRLGEYDVLVGVNLLREGLDLPEVSLVAILDADKEGFLRGKTALIQTIGRAARNVNGKVLLYADQLTEAIKGALDETNRRRACSSRTTRSTGSRRRRSRRASPTSPSSSPSSSRPSRRGVAAAAVRSEGWIAGSWRSSSSRSRRRCSSPRKALRFEYAAKLRDEIKDLRRELEALEEAPG